MLTSISLSVALVLITIALVLSLLMFPAMTRQRGGKILAFFPLFLLPMLSLTLDGEYHLENSKRTEFCLSCHTMSEHGKSLYVDDSTFIPAAHFQRQLVPREKACFTCHTDYTMYGDVTAKWRGLRHVYVYYLGNQPLPPAIELYSPYNNRECLQCHAGARSFEEGFSHTQEAATLPAIRSNELSCLSSGCHEMVHEVEMLNQLEMWQPGTARE